MHHWTLSHLQPISLLSSRCMYTNAVHGEVYSMQHEITRLIKVIRNIIEYRCSDFVKQNKIVFCWDIAIIVLVYTVTLNVTLF